MIICAVDLGAKTGLATYVSETRNMHSKTVDFVKDFKKLASPKFQNFKKNKYAKYAVFYDKIKNYIKHADVVVYEKVRRHISADSAHAYGAFEAMLQIACIELNIECVTLEVSSIKKSATGKGNATKDEMIAAVNAKGHNVGDDNAADAVAMIMFFLKSKHVSSKDCWCNPKVDSLCKSVYIHNFI